jgi:hypothetical protein
VPLQDLAQSIPGVAIAALLPGFALATLLSPRWQWWTRLAISPGLSAGFIGVFGMAMHDVHIPFEPVTVFPLLAILGGAAVFRWRRATPGPGVALPWWIPIPGLLIGVVGAAVFVWALHGQVLPPDWDAPTHGGLAATIARTHDVLPLIPIPLQATEFVRVRPGFEAMAAVVSWLGGPSPAASMAPVVTATLVLLPLSLTLLALEATGSIALAAVVPFFALGMAFPSYQAILGRFPEMVDSTLIVPFVVATLRVMRGVFTRDNLLLLFAITASIWVIHGLEVFTALVVACGLLAWTAFRMIQSSPRLALLRIAGAAGAVLVGAVLVTVLTRMPHVPPENPTEPSSVVLPTVSSPVQLHQIAAAIAQTDLVSPITLVLFAIGVVTILIRRRMLWVLFAQILLVLLMVDDLYLHKLDKIWRIIYPWGDADRILGVQYWLIPLVLGTGFLALVSLVRSLSRTRQMQVRVAIAAVVVLVVAVVLRHPLGQLWADLIGKYPYSIFPLGVLDPLSALRPWLLAVGVAALAVVIAWLAMARGLGAPRFVGERLGAAAEGLDVGGIVLGIVAVVCVVVGASVELGVYQHEVATRSLVSPADVTVLNRMGDVLPKGAIVMNDGGDDAGEWLAALTDFTPLVPNGFAWKSLDTPLDVDLENACTDPDAAESAIQQSHADAVFMGSLHIVPPLYPWNFSCISRLPDLRLIVSVPGDGAVSAAFAVIK